MQIIKHSRLTAALMAAGAVAGASAASPAAAPHLVVGIIVEGLSYDDIELYRPTMGAGGFNRVARTAVCVPAIDYGPERSPTAALATLMTGTPPRVNGIDAPTRFDRETRSRRSVVYDPTYIGNFTSETFSPAAISVSTLADELRSAYAGTSRIYTIAPTAEAAVIAGGHGASSAVWITDTDGRWATSTFYRDMPQLVSDRNYRRPLAQRLDTISWAGGSGTSAFRYAFPRKDTRRFEHFKASPAVNAEVTDLAADYLQWMARSRTSSGATDMLTLVYTVAPYPFADSPATLEAENAEAYRRLDFQISQLLSEIDRTVGLRNTVVYIAGIPAEPLGRPVDSRWGIPSGEFSPRRAKGLLNMYLMVLHGNGEWVTAVDGLDVYLNTTLASERGLSPALLRREAAEFLTRMSGVVGALAADDILASPSLRDGWHAQSMPDVVMEVNPGWRLVETDNPRLEGKTVSHAATAHPLYILYPSATPATLEAPTEAAAVAPTLSRAIRIRAPNAAKASPIRQ